MAEEYHAWLQSEPFDIGNTIENALYLTIEQLSSGRPKAIMIWENAKKLNAKSESNESLMRCTQIAVAASKLSVQETIEIAMRDTTLTHPNKSCVESTTAYV